MDGNLLAEQPDLTCKCAAIRNKVEVALMLTTNDRQSI